MAHDQVFGDVLTEQRFGRGVLHLAEGLVQWPVCSSRPATGPLPFKRASVLRLALSNIAGSVSGSASIFNPHAVAIATSGRENSSSSTNRGAAALWSSAARRSAACSSPRQRSL